MHKLCSDCVVGSINKTVFEGHIIVTTTFMATKCLLCLKSLREASYLHNKHTDTPQVTFWVLQQLPICPPSYRNLATSVLFPCPHSHSFSFQEFSLPHTSHLSPSHFLRASSTFSSLKTLVTMPGLSDILP